MPEPLRLVMALACGLLVGFTFYGGLWMTVRYAISSSRITFWFLTSLLVRTSVALGGFYLVARAGWQGILLCLLGFITARLVVTWCTRPRAMLHRSVAETGRAT